MTICVTTRADGMTVEARASIVAVRHRKEEPNEMPRGEAGVVVVGLVLLTAPRGDHLPPCDDLRVGHTVVLVMLKLLAGGESRALAMMASWAKTPQDEGRSCSTVTIPGLRSLMSSRDFSIW